MRKGWILVLALIAGITMFLVSDLFAWGNQGGKHGKRGGQNWQRPSAEQSYKGSESHFGMRGLGMREPGMLGSSEFLFTEMQEAMRESIAELSGKPVEEITADLKTHSKRALLMKYEINKNNLHQTMKPKVEGIINKAAEEGRLTKEEQEFMLNHPRIR